jgi:putative ABC transport system permease protein
MYVAVTERISEIGLKKALGAKHKDILYEFLFEAVLLTLLGGVIGIIFGVVLSFAVAKAAQSIGMAWDFIVPLSGIIIGVSVSGIIGLLFGVLPARNAARLDPIEALRAE